MLHPGPTIGDLFHTVLFSQHFSTTGALSRGALHVVRTTQLLLLSKDLVDTNRRYRISVLILIQIHTTPLSCLVARSHHSIKVPNIPLSTLEYFLYDDVHYIFGRFQFSTQWH